MTPEQEALAAKPGEDPELVDAFREQIGELIQELQGLVDENQPVSHLRIYEVLRMAHRFKGDAIFLKLPSCHEFAREVEKVLKSHLKQGEPPPPKLADIIALLRVRQDHLASSLSDEERLLLSS